MGKGKKQITIHVFVICYNQARYIEDALRGVNSQIVNANIELKVYIADDNSSDNTLSIIKTCEADANSSYSYLTSSARLGMVDNYRRLLDHVDGDYICILEGDDYWTDDHKLQKQIDFMEKHQECMLCYTDCDILTERYDGQVEWNNNIFERGHSYINTNNPLFEISYQGNVTWMIRSNLFDTVSIPDNCSDIPLIFLYEACLRGKVLQLKGCSTAVFRRHIGSVSNSNENIRHYHYLKNVFFLRMAYSSRFGIGCFNQKLLYYDALKHIHPLSVENGDEEFQEMVEHYFSAVDFADLCSADNYINAPLNANKQKLYRKLTCCGFVAKIRAILSHRAYC